MAYFTNQNPEQPHRQIFNVPIPDDDPYADDQEDEEQPDEPMTDEEFDEMEARENRRDRFRVYAGIGNFVGVIAGTLVILAMIAILISMISWVIDDMGQSFTLLQSWFGTKG